MRGGVTGCYVTAAAAHGLMASAQGASVYWLSGAFNGNNVCCKGVSLFGLLAHTQCLAQPGNPAD